MKKNLLAMTAMLSLSVAFVSCSKTDVFEENQQNLVEQEKTEYRTNFEQMYGTVSSTQSWDLCANPSDATSTRAGETLSWGVLNPLNDWLTRFVYDDLDGVKKAIANAEVKTWNPYLAVDLFPAYSYVSSSNNYDYYYLSVCANGKEENIYWQGLGLIKGWRTLGRFGRWINSKSLNTVSNAYWTLYPTTYSLFSGENVDGKIEDYKIDSYKEFTVNGRTYWGFRVGEKGSYSDFVCMVRNIDPVRPIQKRYMIEDLGSKKDFDFNDVVVDVYQDINGKQKAIIRALGGTIEFTLKIGDTEWRKGVEGVAAGYDVSTMYNTQNPEWDKVLAEFEVKGWNPSLNNVTLTANSVTNKGVIITIPFPRVGEVPMIIATDTYVDWQLEKESLPKDYWTPANEETKE